MIWRPPSTLSTIDPISWAYRCRRIQGKPLDHRIQPFSLEPLWTAAESMEPGERGTDITVLKGRQTGLTTAMVTFGLWHLDMHGGEVIHATPTEQNSLNFNSTVLTPSIEETEFLNIEPSDKLFNRRVKKFDGRSKAIYLIGHTLGGNSTSEGDYFRGETAEVILLDERGQMPERAVAIIESCADTVMTPIIWNTGSAGFKGDSLDRSFLAGTRAEWAIECFSCMKHTVLAPYGSTVDAILNCYDKIGDQYFYRCEHCGNPINPSDGEWVHSEGDYPTFHVASMNSTFLDAQRLHKKIRNPNSTTESLMREVAGLPYGGSGIVLNPEDIHFGRLTESAPTVSIGVDWGDESDYVVLKEKDGVVYVVEAGRVSGHRSTHAKQLYEIALRYHPEYIAADKGYDQGRNEQLNDLTGNTWAMITSLSPKPGGLYENIQRDRKVRVYRLSKTYVWERILEDLRTERLLLAPGMDRLKDDILAVSPDIAGRMSRDWVSYDTTKQHLAACLIYAMAVHYRENNKSKMRIGKGNPQYLNYA